MKNILMILTSHSKLENTDSKTGVWLGEFTDPYYEFKDAGYNITLASPHGGEPPVDDMSKMTENITASNKRFQDDEELKTAFSSTKKLNEIDPKDYDAVFFPGGHGPMFDLAKDPECGEIIVSFFNDGKPISAVCHGSAAFLSTENIDKNFLNGRRISCFTNTEETLAMKKGKVPYLLEDALKDKGAEIKTSLIPFTSHVEQDGIIITGQNPISAGPTARKLIEVLDNM